MVNIRSASAGKLVGPAAFLAARGLNPANYTYGSVNGPKVSSIPNTMGGVAQPTNTTQSTPVTGGIQNTQPMGGSASASKQAALARLEQVGSGQNAPITEAQKSGMMSAQSDMSAAAEAQQNAALRRTTAAGGGSLYDPSHGAAERENTSDRQLANQEAKRDIDLKAAGTNYEAEFAANRLLAAQEDPYSGGGTYGSGSVGAPSATPGGDRVRGYSGQFDLSQGNLTTTNPDRASVGLRTPVSGGSTAVATGGRGMTEWDYKAQQDRAASEAKALAGFKDANAGKWKWKGNQKVYSTPFNGQYIPYTP